MEKIYEIRWSWYGAISEWHSGDVYRTVGYATDVEKAEKIVEKLNEIKDKYGRQKYDCYYRECALGLKETVIEDIMEVWNSTQ